MKHREVIKYYSSTLNRLLGRELGAGSKGRLPHPKPGADSGDIILFHKFVKFMDLRIVLRNEEGKVGPVKRVATGVKFFNFVQELGLLNNRVVKNVNSMHDVIA
jgi:hypothetical protein